MFGYLPNHVDDSLFNMIVYNLFPVETKYDANGPLVSLNRLHQLSINLYMLMPEINPTHNTKEIYLGRSLALCKQVWTICPPTRRILLFAFSIRL